MPLASGGAANIIAAIEGAIIYWTCSTQRITCAVGAAGTVGTTGAVGTTGPVGTAGITETPELSELSVPPVPPELSVMSEPPEPPDPSEPPVPPVPQEPSESPELPEPPEVSEPPELDPKPLEPEPTSRRTAITLELIIAAVRRFNHSAGSSVAPTKIGHRVCLIAVSVTALAS